MSVEKIDINKLYNINNCNHNLSLLYGKITLNYSDETSLLIPGEYSENENVNVILPKDLELNFKNYCLEAPVNKNNVFLYDQMGNKINTWISNRENNNYGDVNIEVDDCLLISNLVIPKFDGKLIVILNNYKALDNCSVKMGKKIIKKDVETFLENNSSVKDSIEFRFSYKFKKILLRFFKDLSSDPEFITTFPAPIFNNESKYNSQNIVLGTVEDIFGKKIAENKDKTNQCYLNILDFDIEACKVIENSNNFNIVPRSNGRISIISKNKSSTCKFVMILKKIKNDLKPEDVINISDSQKNEDKVILFKSELLSLEKIFINKSNDNQFNFFDKMFNEFNYYLKLKNLNGIKLKKVFLNSMKSETFNFLFNECKDFNDELNENLKNEYQVGINNFYKSFYKEIRDTLINLISNKDQVERKSINKENSLFGGTTLNSDRNWNANMRILRGQKDQKSITYRAQSCANVLQH